MDSINMFSQIAFQDALIRKLDDVEANGVGEHKRRSRAAACRKARRRLVELGYSEPQAAQIVEQSVEMWRLGLMCEEGA